MTPDMTEPKAFAQLRDTLADLYSDVESIRRVVVDAGLKEARIAFSDQALASWNSVLQEARKRKKVAEVISVALKEYKENSRLQEVWEIYQTVEEHDIAEVIAPPEVTNISGKQHSIIARKITISAVLVVFVLVVTIFYVVRQNYLKREEQYQIVLNWKRNGSPTLTEFDLVNRDLSNLNLSQADLRGADLQGANLIGADFTEANLQGADLTGADLTEVDLTGADLQGAKIDNTTRLDAKWRLVWEIINHNKENRNLEGADLIGANLQGANLIGDNLQGVDLLWADLTGADLTGADLDRAYLRGTKIDSTTHLDAKWRLVWEIVNHVKENRDLGGANLRRANLDKAHLRGANLSGADLSGADLTSADLAGADLSEAKYNSYTKWPEGFTPPLDGIKVEGEE